MALGIANCVDSLLKSAGNVRFSLAKWVDSCDVNLIIVLIIFFESRPFQTEDLVAIIQHTVLR